MSEKVHRIYVRSLSSDGVMNELQKIANLKGNISSIDIHYEEKEKCWWCAAPMRVPSIWNSATQQWEEMDFCPKCGRPLK